MRLFRVLTQYSLVTQGPNINQYDANTFRFQSFEFKPRNSPDTGELLNQLQIWKHSMESEPETVDYLGGVF